MNSIEVLVPRNVIKKFHPHPEPYGDGDYVVDLINGMFTDVFYREEGHFFTITNDDALIAYLNTIKPQPREYFYRNGVFAFRNIEDYDLELINEWQDKEAKITKTEIKTTSKLPSKFMVCFYWIEVGIIEFKDNLFILSIYENELINDVSIEIVRDLLVEYVSKKTA